MIVSCYSSKPNSESNIPTSETIPWWNAREETIATVTDVWGPPTTVKSYFEAHGKRYVSWGGWGYGRHVNKGDQFVVAYNPANPEQNEFLQARRVISYFGQLNIRFSKGEVIKSERHVGRKTGRVSYRIQCRFEIESINGKNSYSYSALSVNNNKSQSNIEDLSGKFFRVVYDQKNDLQSIILLNEPIPDSVEVDPFGKDRNKKVSRDNPEIFITPGFI
jgi:hypothetical protein